MYNWRVVLKEKEIWFEILHPLQSEISWDLIEPKTPVDTEYCNLDLDI